MDSNPWNQARITVRMNRKKNIATPFDMGFHLPAKMTDIFIPAHEYSFSGTSVLKFQARQ